MGDGAMADGPQLDLAHPLLVAVRPLLDRVGGELVPEAELQATDVPLVWEGEVVGGVRLPSAGSAPEGSGSLDQMLSDLAGELGAPLSDLPRAEKQRAVRVLEERGAFAYRRSAETVAEALGVTRFTVYNYLNRSSR
jgi:hypothetical protein